MGVPQRSSKSEWEWPSQSDKWVILKADVTKARRRIKVLPDEWKYQVAELQGEWFVNMLAVTAWRVPSCTGVDRRLPPSHPVRSLPVGRLVFVFVDDYAWLLRADNATLFAVGICLLLLSLGVPLSWKKTLLAEVNTWVGFVINPVGPVVQMAKSKHLLVMEALQDLAEGKVMSAARIASVLGRVQWATTACPTTRRKGLLGLEAGMQVFWQATDDCSVVCLSAAAHV